MMTSLLKLGEVTFDDFEIPEFIGTGGKQRLVIHSLPGGGRVVDALGFDDAPIRWSGIFSGQQAAGRVRALDRLRRGGQRQLLTWDAWRFTVVVQEFDTQIASNGWIPYQIQLCVVASESEPDADWLDSAHQPTLTVGLTTVAALEAAIGVATLGLTSNNVGSAIGAAGSLAQYVTARAYGLGGS